MPDDSYLTKQAEKELKRMNKNILSHKYLWSLTQNFDIYSDICTSIKTFEDENIGSYCKIFRIKNQNIIYIWFKGTELSIKDLLVDMFFFKKKLENGMKVHAGFWSAYETLHKKIYEYLICSIIMDTKIVIFGHSLGAAMAKECARRIHKYYNAKVITFGTPRTGNKKYTKLFDKIDILEYINRADIVTKLPLRIMNYKHTSKIKRFGKWGLSIKAHLNYGEYL